MLPRAATNFSRTQQRVSKVARLQLARQWRRGMRENWDTDWRRISTAILATLSAAQQSVARESMPYVAALAARDGLQEAPMGTLVPTALAGIASDGRPLETLAYGAVVAAGQAYNAGSNVRQALSVGGAWLDMMAWTQIADAARVATSVGTVVRPEWDGYVRVLNPPSCSRCAVLAGKMATWDVGYERHPGCDCYSIPVKSMEAARSEGLLMHPKDYFDTLSKAEQDRIFTKKGAEAIRDGADPAQVVNARRGMRPAQLYGHDVLLTTEGTTKSGLAFKALHRGGGGTTTIRQAEELATRLTRNGPELRRIHRTRARSPRLMPESIYAIAKDREDAVRLLRAHGFIL